MTICDLKACGDGAPELPPAVPLSAAQIQGRGRSPLITIKTTRFHRFETITL